MAGGARQQQQSNQLDPQTAVQNAQQSGMAGAVGNMPQWQRGLYGAMTGSPAFGPNAPFIHQLLTQGQRPMPGQMPPQGQPMQQGMGGLLNG